MDKEKNMEKIVEEKKQNNASSETLTVQAILYGSTRKKFQKYKRKTGKKNQDIITECVDGFLNE